MRRDNIEPPDQVEFGGVIRDINNNNKEKAQASLEASCVYMKASCDVSYSAGLSPLR